MKRKKSQKSSVGDAFVLWLTAVHAMQMTWDRPSEHIVVKGEVARCTNELCDAVRDFLSSAEPESDGD